MKNLFILMFFNSILCTKAPIVTPLQFQKQLLSGTGFSQDGKHVWILDSTSIDGIKYPLTNHQKNFKKEFHFNGNYIDSDNINGFWDIPIIDQLSIIYVYPSHNLKDTVVYDIKSLDAARMNISRKLSNGQIAVYSFKIVF
jgi:hypothetical protein